MNRIPQPGDRLPIGDGRQLDVTLVYNDGDEIVAVGWTDAADAGLARLIGKRTQCEMRYPSVTNPSADQ